MSSSQSRFWVCLSASLLLHGGGGVYFVFSFDQSITPPRPIYVQVGFATIASEGRKAKAPERIDMPEEILPTLPPPQKLLVTETPIEKARTVPVEELAPPPKKMAEKKPKVEPEKLPPPVVVKKPPRPKIDPNVEIAQAPAPATIQSQASTGANEELSMPRTVETNIAPQYPAEAQIQQWTGKVKLRVLVTVEGTVGAISVHQSSGYSVLDEAALAGVRAWRFIPARRGRTPISFEMVVPITYGLR